jgi:hypothetical protein
MPVDADRRTDIGRRSAGLSRVEVTGFGLRGSKRVEFGLCALATTSGVKGRDMSLTRPLSLWGFERLVATLVYRIAARVRWPPHDARLTNRRQRAARFPHDQPAVPRRPGR